MTEVREQTEWTPAQLLQALEKERDFFVFDVREESEYDAWKIEGRKPIPMANVPYYEMLEVDDHDDIVDSFVDYLGRGWSD